MDRPALEVSVDPKEMWDGLTALLAERPELFLEVGELFLVEEPAYEPGGIYNYLFAIAPTPADGTGNRYLAFVPRNDDERRAVRAAPEKFGIVARGH